MWYEVTVNAHDGAGIPNPIAVCASCHTRSAVSSLPDRFDDKSCENMVLCDVLCGWPSTASTERSFKSYSASVRIILAERYINVAFRGKLTACRANSFSILGSMNLETNLSGNKFTIVMISGN